MKFGVENPSNKKEDKAEDKKSKKDSEITRRDFFKWVGFAAGSVAITQIPFSEKEELKPKSDVSTSEQETKIAEEKVDLMSTKEQRAIKIEEIKSIWQVLDYNKKGKLDYNMETVEVIKKIWRKKYSEDPKMVNSFKYAHREMGAWEEYLIEAMQKGGLSKDKAKEIIYLAIPESHWRPKDVSDAGAVGPYQFLSSTAKSFGLNKNKKYKNIDERMDPILSAEACAKHIMDVADRANNNHNIAISGYNGSFANKYIARLRKKNKSRQEGEPRQKASYEGFVNYIEERINELRDKIRDNKYYHVVKEGENLGNIVKRYHYTNVNSLMAANNIKDPKLLRAGKKIRIPIPAEDKEKAFKLFVAGLSENMVYPAKFDAVKELIDEGFVKRVDQKKTVVFKEHKVEVQKSSLNHTVRDGETLYAISNKYKVNIDKIRKINNIKGNIIQPNSVLKIPNKKFVLPTLVNQAKLLGKSVEHLEYLNPAVVNSKKLLPEGYKLRY